MAKKKTVDAVEFRAETKQFNKSIARMRRNLKKFTRDAARNVSRVADGLSSFAKRAFLGIGVALGLSQRTFEDFQENLTRTSITLRATAKETDALGTKIRQIAKETPKTAGEVANAANYLAQAGLNVNQTMEALEPSIKLAVIANLDLGEATDLATDTMAAFRLEAKDLTRVTDGWLRTSQKANTSVRQLGAATTKSAGTAEQLGIDIDTNTTLLGALAKTMKGEVAGVALNQLYLSLS